jgi:hypothetical protein
MLADVPLDLLVPDLLHPDSDLRMPALERWLARGDAGTIGEGHMLSVAARAHGVKHPVPVGAISLAGDGTPLPGTWLRADPVHSEVRLDAVALRDASGLEVTREEAQALVDELQRHFAADGFEFRMRSPESWSVRVPDGEAPVTVPLPEAEGRDLFGMLPRGQGKVNWPSALTEVQMLFSEHPVNQAREARGQLPVNGVWFWGEGTLPASVVSAYALVYSDDPFVRGLAHLSGARAASPPASWSGVDGVRADQSVLVVLEGPSRAFRRGDEASFRAEAARLDEHWFTTLREGLDRFETVSITLPRGRDSLVVRVTPGARWRFLRGSRPLAAHA